MRAALPLILILLLGMLATGSHLGNSGAQTPVAAPDAGEATGLATMASGGSEVSENSPTTPVEGQGAALYGLPESSGPAVLAHWQGRLVIPLRRHAPGPMDDFQLPVEFDFPLNAKRSVPVRVQRFDVTGPDAGVFTGEVAGMPGTTVVLSFVGLAQAGVVHLPAEGRSFVVQGDAEGRLRITENDLSQAPGCSPPLLPPSI